MVNPEQIKSQNFHVTNLPLVGEWQGEKGTKILKEGPHLKKYVDPQDRYPNAKVSCFPRGVFGKTFYQWLCSACYGGSLRFPFCVTHSPLCPECRLLLAHS